ncbi:MULTISPECIES: xanthine dehydrogenase molybdopterin binding subunit [Halomonadaceae]|uniref:xanthine dehydrogenase molybdopterin binding subunit n=1 Tax=Halomonadaceae TaxID=28256 RepID=UPI00159ADBD0|nr:MULTISPECIES: xanthine dehydrogenase molybdopterin binding subunit [Halomonas]QJQ96597.1 xanthine dehydrogenase molybdopterin binding subunit [Halomonas sp. PA5]
MRTLTDIDADSAKARREQTGRNKGDGPLAREAEIPHTQHGSAGHGYKHESAVKHVTGRAAYIDDLPAPADTLHVAVGLSPVAHGRLTRLDLEQARRAPGVVEAITFIDIPGHTDIGPVFAGDPLFVDDEISYVGQTLFAVAAVSYRAARLAVREAIVEIDEQSASLDPVAAAEREEFVRPTHVQGSDTWQAALDEAAHVLEGEQFVGGQEHLYLEGQACLVTPTEDEGVIVYTSNQHPSETQKLVAEVLDIPFHAVTVETRRMGGGFGGKETQASPWTCIAAIVARRTGRSVRLRLPRAEDMRATGKRHPFHNRYRLGFDAQGVLLGGDLTLIGDCGFSPDLSEAIVDRAMFHADNAYSLGQARVTGHRARTHKASNTAFRGFGGPQGMMLIEAAMDDIARRIGEDPLTVRKRNFYRTGRDVTHYGQRVEQLSLLHDLVAQLEATSDYWARRRAITDFNARSPIVKKGLALTPVKFGISFTAQHLNQAGALLHVYTDGSVMINHGGTEMGQGLHTKICQVVARELGLDIKQVRITATRTDKVPNTSPTAASSGADLNGQAARDAAARLRERLLDFAASHFYQDEGGLDREAMRLERGYLVVDSGDESRRIGWGELVQAAYLGRISLSEKGFYSTPLIHYDRTTAKGRPFYYYAYGAAVSEVAVDTLTGEYQVTRVDILHDVGDSLNSAIDIGQVEGGFIQGMGWLTCEELKWNDAGRLLSDGPSTYKIPAFGDLPSVFNVELMQGHPNSQASIYRSKAVGEPPFMLGISVWSALRDALASLADYRQSPPLDTPATPERVLMAAEALRHARP